MFLRTLEGLYPPCQRSLACREREGTVFGMLTKWCLRQVATDHLPKAVPTQRTEGGWKGRGALVHVSQQEGARGQGELHQVQGHCGHSGGYGLMRRNGCKGGRREER